MISIGPAGFMAGPPSPRRQASTFLATCARRDLRRALRFLRRQAACPHEVNPAAAQYDRVATLGQVRAEYRRRGWKLPRATAWERGDR